MCVYVYVYAQLPSTPARTKQIQDISKQLLAAQKHLGSLYSDEETDRSV